MVKTTVMTVKAPRRCSKCLRKQTSAGLMTNTFGPQGHPRKSSSKPSTYSITKGETKQAPDSASSTNSSKHKADLWVLAKAASGPPPVAEMFLQVSSTAGHPKGDPSMETWRCTHKSWLDVGRVWNSSSAHYEKVSSRRH
eukprot:5388335-Amphidinium_carterae.1